MSVLELSHSANLELNLASKTYLMQKMGFSKTKSLIPISQESVKNLNLTMTSEKVKGFEKICIRSVIRPLKTNGPDP